MIRFTDKVQKEVAPIFQKNFGLKNRFMLPKITKVVLNVGLRSDLKDPRLVDSFAADLAAITGQRPVKTLARKSISSFKVRQGQIVGLAVTLRGRRMYEFLDKLFNVTLARVRDFRGLSESGFDLQGNYSIGLRDQIAFPEISPDSVLHLFGLQVTINVQAKSKQMAVEFLRLAGLPLRSGKEKQ
ncbi:MAG: 50S ribosomal protein L5 [Candidatus Doudnabacteria bacterium]|nr:50S ribosomal protein L5 [Candidatus Doudnabacteria bacterium]